jgi:hypothetical protein
MKAETRQTAIGVSGLTVVMVVALHEGFNGRVTMAYFLSVLAIIAPEALDQLNLLG